MSVVFRLSGLNEIQMAQLEALRALLGGSSS